MGFLMGAYGKLMAGKLVRDLQYRLTSVTRRAMRVTREIGDKEKMYQAQERNMKQAMQAQMQAGLMGLAGMPMGYGVGMMDVNAAMNMWGGMSQSQMTAYTQGAQMLQMQFAQAQTMWQNMFELQKDADLQALKDLQDELETEKLNLESRIKLAEQQQQYYKEMEQKDVKGLVPETQNG